MWLTAEGWTLRQLPLAEACEGDTDHEGHVIAAATYLEPAARLVVLLREAAHGVLHEQLDAIDYQALRGVCETEAESTAYVLANLLGLDVDASSISHMAGWSRSEPTALTATASNVLHAVNTIAAGLGLDADRADEPAEATSAV